MTQSISNGQELQQKLFIKRFLWVFLLTLVGFSILLGCIIYSNYRQNEIDQERERQKQIDAENDSNYQPYQYIEPTMTEDEFETAIRALENGVSIDDPANDFVVTPPQAPGLDGKNDRQYGYALEWNDIKRISFGADDEQFYIRAEMYGTIPETMVTIEGDDIKGMGCNVSLSAFETNNRGIDEGMWQVGIMFTEQHGKDSKDESAGYDVITPRLGVTSIASPTVTQDKYGETIYEVSSSNGNVAGGAGEDYVMASFPLDDLDIVPGSTISFEVSVETASRQYHHSSIDFLFSSGSAKAGMTINYNLGSNTYTTTMPENIPPTE